MTWRQPLVALLMLGLLVHLGMAVRTASALRRVGVPASRAWTASLLAWPLVRRLVAGHADETGPPGPTEHADEARHHDEIGPADGTGQDDLSG
jgi:hypothetical protein